MEEILYQLRNHAAGLNAGRWDYIFSLIKNYRDRGPAYVLPDRAEVTMTQPMMRSYTEQLVRVQNIKVHMLRADALATNAFLVGGLEAPEVREKYTESLTAASRTIAEAAEAQPLDGAVLAELNQVLIDYAEGMAQARATNRQGLPVGAGYLRASSAELRDRGVTLVDALYEAKVRLIASAAEIPEKLYEEGAGAFEFERTASRLREMQDASWGAEAE